MIENMQIYGDKDTNMAIKIPNTNKIIGGKEIFVIADIGKNFIQTEEEKSVQEYLSNAKKLISEAKKAGADAVKFQTHNLEDEQLDLAITSPHFKGSDRYEWIKRNTKATPFWFWQEIKRYCDSLNIIFFSTPMSRGAAKILEKLDVPLWKVGSGDILDFVMLDFIADTGKSIIISTGMSRVDEVDMAIEFLKKRTDKIVVLHCVSKYPCPVKDLNLGAINFLEEKYNLLVGFSSHAASFEGALEACDLGACVIEKHFTLDRGLWGSDHKASLLPNEFKEMVRAIRKREGEIKQMGPREQIWPEKNFMNEDEAVFRPVFRKSLMAGKDIKTGDEITSDKLYAMRPQKYAGGLPSENYEKVLSKKAKKDLKKYDPITWEVLE